MSSEGSIAYWLGELQAGNLAAAQPLWERYFPRLVELARARLRGAPRAAADEEDAALSAFDSFCRGVARGRFPQLADRHNLWHLLVVLTARKAARQRLHERRLKRGGGAVLDEAALPGVGPEGEAVPFLEQVVGREPSPAFAAEMADECRRLLARLDDPELVSVALWKMEGCTSAEIAAKTGYTVRTIERKLELIRRIWSEEVGQAEIE